MKWEEMTPEQKTKWLTAQKAEIQRAKALLERFDKVTDKWLKRTQARGSQKPA